MIAIFLIEFISKFKAGKCTVNYQYTNYHKIVVENMLNKSPHNKNHEGLIKLLMKNYCKINFLLITPLVVSISKKYIPFT